MNKFAFRVESYQAQQGAAKHALHSPKNFEHLRREVNKEDLEISEAMIDWLKSLPASLRPKKLIAKFPRIANTLAKTARRPRVLHARLKEYMLDNRGDRQGFPFDVLQEMADLLEYYEQAGRHDQQDIWADIKDKNAGR